MKPNLYPYLLFCAAIHGLMAVMIAAYTTHGVTLEPTEIAKLTLASQYQLIHAVLLVAISFYGLLQKEKAYFFLGVFFLFNLFSRADPSCSTGNSGSTSSSNV